MDILYLLIPLSVVLVFLIGTVFWLALRSGQFDDLEGPAFKILLDDDAAVAAGKGPARADGEPPGGFDLNQAGRESGP
jgi:cbb3-type cytochrome oxidase maturation protein